MANISIIVPIYNSEENLENCIVSIINQTYKDIQIVLVNDGSTDKSIDICSKYEQIDNRIKVINIENSGVSVARNTGMRYSKSKYIMFVDSDDSIDLNIIEKLLNIIEEKDYDLSMCGYKRVFKKNGLIEKVQGIKCSQYSGNIKNFLNNIDEYIDNPLLQGPCWKIFKKSIIIENNIEFPENMSYGEDTTFVYSYLEHVNYITTIDEELYNYYIDEKESLSTVFRVDKYSISLFLNSKLEKMLKSHGIHNKKDFLNKQVCDTYIAYIGSIFRCKTKTNKKNKYDYIFKATSNIETKKAFRYIGNDSLQYKYLDKCISNLDIERIYKYFIVKEYVRLKMEPIYKNIKVLLK